MHNKEEVIRFIAEFQKRIPPGTDYEKEFQGMVLAIIKKLSKKFDINIINLN